MNNRQLYLAWLRTEAPTVYASAVRRATGQTRSVGGLTDDLVQQSFAPNLSHSFLGDDTSAMDLPPIDFQTPTFDTSLVATPAPVSFDMTPALPSFAPTAPPASSGSTFSNILTAVTAIGAGVLNYSNQSKLISLNTTRAQQGLAPVDAYGRLITPARTTATGSALLAFERAISGGSSGSMLPLVLGVLGVGAAFMMFSRRSAS